MKKGKRSSKINKRKRNSGRNKNTQNPAVSESQLTRKDILRYATPEQLKASVDDYFSRKPLLTPRLKNWEEDLPANSEKQVVPGQLIQVTEINDIWMEVPRYENTMWGLEWFGVIASILAFIIVIGMSIAIIFLPDFNFSSGYDISMIAILWGGGGIFLSMLILFLRMALFVPRDQPIRFNRKRQKIYIFEHHRKAWNPWAKWPTTVRVFDWADIHGEISHESDRLDQGFRLYGAICKPGTLKVTERVILNYSIYYIQLQRELWSHWCQYMQHQPVVMDPLCPPPGDGRPQKKAKSLWPEALDRESRTAPESDF
ncbi:DUF6708 domain-containing protein [uncultured Cedecea sp.]|uniref:DUF6708 domain-containing protein n=1 Tax=uncultured Cedecea sp. TaxID=988762 RepID=UPI002636CED8|nr:DUF6708 domain-containing protein [uncultured Cedecea sp.]